jgi:hypothetical protein
MDTAARLRPVPSTGTAWATACRSRTALAATLHNPYGVDDDEEGNPVWVCTGQRRPWPAVWAAFRHYD